VTVGKVATIKYKGHHILGHTHRDIDCETMLRYKVKESREVEVSEREAKRLLHLYPMAFERVEGRSLEKPEHNRMVRNPFKKRAKRKRRGKR
jgi:hypothetical protein